MFYTSLVEFLGRTNITIRTSDSQASPWTSKAGGQSSKKPVHHRHEGAGEQLFPTPRESWPNLYQEDIFGA